MEHMIFLGSKKWPEENSYSDHIAQSGGFVNAYTMYEWTNYQFECNYSGLETAIDMMASNFASPLMNLDSMDREVSSIESEY